jgi:hypothetical protein
MLSNSIKSLTPDEEKWWGLQSVMARHQYLALSAEQAEMIYTYEQEKENKSEIYFLTFWEEGDFNLMAYKEILTSAQLDIYKSFLKTNSSRYEEDLKIADVKPERLNELAYCTEMLSFYEGHLFPGFINAPFKELVEETIADKAKIEWLKKKYRIFLNNGRKKLIIEELRDNRIFSPNKMKITLLKHDLNYLWPDYFSFKAEADTETKNIIVHLENQILLLPDKVYSFINEKLKALKDFNAANFEKYYSNIKFDYVANDYVTDEEIKINSLMCFLLFDKEKYISQKEKIIPEGRDPDAPLIYL